MSSETATMTDATLTAPAVDPDKLMAFVFRAVEEAGAALNCALVVIGDRLGYYRNLAEHGPGTPAELAERTNTDAHYAREWLNAQAAGPWKARQGRGAPKMPTKPTIRKALNQAKGDDRVGQDGICAW